MPLAKLAKFGHGSNEVLRIYPVSALIRSSSSNATKGRAGWPISYASFQVIQDFDEVFETIAQNSNVEIVDRRPARLELEA